MNKVICILLIISFVLGVSGCMNNEIVQAEKAMELPQISEQDILSYLSDKYSKTFEITQLSQEFNGNNGVYYRAVFTGTDNPEKGVLYCYADGYGEGDKVNFGGKQVLVTDNYANILLQTEYAAALQTELGDQVLVKCRLETPNCTISNADLAAGLKACLENAELNPYLHIFVFADSESKSTGLKEAAEAFLGKYNVYNQYLYIGYQDQINLSLWNTLYLENYSGFEYYLVDDSDMDYVVFSAFSLDNGMTESSVLKE